MEQSDVPVGQTAEVERVLKRVDRMVEAGRVTSEEAARVRATSDSGEIDDAIREIRLRHARARFAEEVSDGRLTQDEADLILRRIENGEHRGLLRDLRRGKSSGVAAPPPASRSENADPAGDEHGRGSHG